MRLGIEPLQRAPWGLLAIVAVLTVASIGPAGVGRAAPEPVAYGMVFPLLGVHTLTDSFGDPRGNGRSHQGVDILADRLVPVVAVADGTVRWVHDGRDGHRCCDLAVRHDDGWSSRYFHLNNDTPGSDDGRAVGIAPGIRRGARVVAGQLVGWVGDSGNAEATVPHLHFELRRPDGRAVDPLPSLRAALVTGRALAPPPQVAAGGAEADGGGLLGWLLGAGEEEAAGEAPAPPAAVPPGLAPPSTAGTAAEQAAPAVTTPPAPPVEAAVERVPAADVAAGAPPGLRRARRVERLPVPPRRGEPEPRRDALSCFGFASRRGGGAGS